MTEHVYGVGIKIGSRVELHPACDLWMRGARYGEVTGNVGPVLVVKLDKYPHARRFEAQFLRVIK